MVDIVDTLWRVHNDPAAGHEAVFSSTEIDPPFSLADGQQYQCELLGRWLTAGEQIGGWKIGMTSGASRNAMGDGVRPFGFVLSSRIKSSQDKLSVAALHRGQIENELCFLIGRELGAGASREDALQAVEAVLPAFEINQKRLPANVAPALRVADDLSNWGIAIGEPVTPPENLSALTVTLSGAGGVIEQVTTQGHIDDHYESLATLARGLAEYGFSLMPGQYVITGAYAKTPFAPGTYTGEFDLGIGAVTVNLV